MEGTFHEGLALVHEVLEGIDAFEDKLDEHHVVFFLLQDCLSVFWVADYEMHRVPA